MGQYCSVRAERRLEGGLKLLQLVAAGYLECVAAGVLCTLLRKRVHAKVAVFPDKETMHEAGQPQNVAPSAAWDGRDLAAQWTTSG